MNGLHRGIGYALLFSIPCWAVLIGGGILLASAAHAEPNTETQLPAGGVTSIERTGDTWTVVTTGPASEIKYMGPGAQQIVCGTNYGRPCTTSVTFTAAGECVYLQADGVPGHNSTDPFICRGGTPSTTTPTPSTVPTSTSSPTSTPTPTSLPTSSSPDVTPAAPTPAVARTDISASTLSTAATTTAPARLADTGTDMTGYIVWAALAVLAITVGMIYSRIRGFERGSGINRWDRTGGAK